MNPAYLWFLPIVVFFGLLVLKLIGFIMWTWWAVFSPLLLLAAVVIIFVIAFFFAYTGPQ